MSLFAYRAVNAAGEIESGTVDALSRELAAQSLSRGRLVPIEILEAKGSAKPAVSIQFGFRRKKQASTREVLAITQQLGALTTSGLTLDRALTISARLSQGKAEKALLSRLLEGVRRGGSFAELIAAEGNTFPEYYQAMIRAGEAGGNLEMMLSRISTLMARSQDARDRVTAALIYPAILFAMIGVTLAIVLVFVLPRFESLFAEAGSQLPLATRVVIGIGDITREYGFIIAAVFAAGVLILHRLVKTPHWRIRIDAWLLRRRLFQELTGARESARYARTLGSLLDGGLPMPSAMRIASGTLRNLTLKQAAQSAQQSVKEGRGLSSQLATSGCFPPILVQLSSVGEETGTLGASLQQSADMLDSRVQQSIERTIAVMVPLTTVLMGALVAVIIGSVLIGILSINDLAG